MRWVICCEKALSSLVLHNNDVLVSPSALKDIVPMLSEDGYEGFPELCERANTWLKDQSDVLIVNMQSLMVQKDDGESLFDYE